MGLSHSIQNKVLHKHGNQHYRVGSACMQGFRVEMEDAHSVVLSLPAHPNVSFFGVFDGHGGDMASKYCAERLPALLNDTVDVFQPHILSQICLLLDEEFLQHEKAQHGTTATFALIRPHANHHHTYEVMLGNIGDSRCVWISQHGHVMHSTMDHKPKLPSETERITKAAGFVSGDRVDGELAVSRAFGDASFKKNASLPLAEQKVCAVPDVQILTIPQADSLLLACDGIYDKLTNEQIAEFVRDELSATPGDPSGVASRLVDYALRSGSRDNMSAVLVHFCNGEAYDDPEADFVAGPYYQWVEDTRFQKAYLSDAMRWGMFGRQLYDLAYVASCEEVERNVQQLIFNANGDKEKILDLRDMKAQMLEEIKALYEKDLETDSAQDTAASSSSATASEASS